MNDDQSKHFSELRKLAALDSKLAAHEFIIYIAFHSDLMDDEEINEIFTLAVRSEDEEYTDDECSQYAKEMIERIKRL